MHPEHSHPTGEVPLATTATIEILSELPVYAPDSAIVQYVTERVAFICGDDYPVPKVYVRESAEPNAIPLSGCLVVDSGLFDLFDAAEELDAVLAHEIVHLDEDHMAEESPKNVFNIVGQARTHETRSDIRSVPILDQRGINPRGAVSALTKISTWEQRHGKSHMVASPTHGQGVDRAINIDQSFLLIDARNLSQAPLSPLPCKNPNDRGRVTGEQDISGADAVLAQSIVARRFRDLEPTASDPELAKELALQAQLIEQTNAYLLRPEVERLAYTAALRYNPKLAEKILTNGVTPDFVHTFVADIAHDTFVQQCGAVTKVEIRLAATAIMQRTVADPARFDPITASECGNILATVTKSRAFMSEGIKYAAVEQNNREFVDKLVAFVLRTDLPLDSLYFSDPLMEQRYASRVARARFEAHKAIQQTGDTLAIIRNLQRIRNTLAVDAAVEDDDHQVILEGAYEFTYWESIDWETILGLSPAERDTSKKLNPNLNVLLGLDLTDDGLRALVRQAHAEGLSREDARILAAFATAVYEAFAEGGMLTEMRVALLPAYLLLEDYDTVEKILLESSLQMVSGRWSKEAMGASDKRAKEVYGVSMSTGKGRSPNLYRSQIGKWERVLRVQVTDYASQYSNLITDIETRNDTLRDHRLLVALEQLHFNGDPSQLHALLYQQSIMRIRQGGAFTDQSKLEDVRFFWESATTRLLAEPDLLSNPNHLLTLVALGSCAENISVNLHVPAEAMRLFIQQQSFDEALQAVFITFAHLPMHVMRSAIEELVESKARTLDEFARLDHYMQGHLERMAHDEQYLIGLGSIIETNIIDAYKTQRGWERRTGVRTDQVVGLESVRLIKALLGTMEDDSDIRRYVFERWWLRYRTTSLHPELEGYFKVEDIAVWRYPHKKVRLRYWINELPEPGTYTPIEESLNNLYLANAAARYALVRKILLGEGGALEDDIGRQGVVEGLMGSWLKFEEGSTAHKVLYNLLGALMKTAKSDELYKFISPVLQELVLRPPKEPASNADIAGQQARQVLHDMKRRHILSATDSADEANVHQKIVNLMRGSIEAVVSRTGATEALLALFGDTAAYEFKKVSPTELALMTGKKSGSLGVRMLQLAGQYYDIPEEERDEYNEVYDGMKGQSRLQAYRTLLREANHSQTVAELLPRIASIDERLGGGSQVTVLGITLVDGSKEILGVRNPNAEYHVDHLSQVVQQALVAAVAKDPNNLDLQMAQTLVADAVTWIKAELNDFDFPIKDAVFRVENDTQQGTSFGKGNSRYELYVPTAPASDSAWIRRETFVPGVNLNGLKISETEPTNLADKRISQEDYRHAVSLLVRNYVHQIRQGKVLYPDIHPGNFRITEDNKSVAVFDRYGLIPITDALRSTMQQTFQAAIAGNIETAIEGVVRYSTAGHSVDTQQHTQNIIGRLPSAHRDPATAMMQTIIEVKKEGITIPIQLSLLMRNIYSLSKMAQRGGFANLGEAFAYTAAPDELGKTMEFFARS